MERRGNLPKMSDVQMCCRRGHRFIASKLRARLRVCLTLIILFPSFFLSYRVEIARRPSSTTSILHSPFAEHHKKNKRKPVRFQMATEGKQVMVVGIDDSEHSTYALEWTLDHFFSPSVPNNPFRIVIVHAKSTPASAIGLAGPGNHSPTSLRNS